MNPLYAYAPGYIPHGARYWRWESSARWLTIRFRRTDSLLEALSFSAGPRPPLGGRCNGAHAGTTFRLHGVTVYWAATYEDQEAWRCVRARDGRVIALSAAQSISGQGADNPKSHWALDLVRVVASGHRIT